MDPAVAVPIAVYSSVVGGFVVNWNRIRKANEQALSPIERRRCHLEALGWIADNRAKAYHGDDEESDDEEENANELFRETKAADNKTEYVRISLKDGVPLGLLGPKWPNFNAARATAESTTSALINEIKHRPSCLPTCRIPHHNDVSASIFALPEDEEVEVPTEVDEVVLPYTSFKSINVRHLSRLIHHCLYWEVHPAVVRALFIYMKAFIVLVGERATSLLETTLDFDFLKARHLTPLPDDLLSNMVDACACLNTMLESSRVLVKRFDVYMIPCVLKRRMMDALQKHQLYRWKLSFANDEEEEDEEMTAGAAAESGDGTSTTAIKKSKTDMNEPFWKRSRWYRRLESASTLMPMSLLMMTLCGPFLLRFGYQAVSHSLEWVMRNFAVACRGSKVDSTTQGWLMESLTGGIDKQRGAWVIVDRMLQVTTNATTGIGSSASSSPMAVVGANMSAVLQRCLQDLSALLGKPSASGTTNVVVSRRGADLAAEGTVWLLGKLWDSFPSILYTAILALWRGGASGFMMSVDSKTKLDVHDALIHRVLAITATSDYVAIAHGVTGGDGPQGGAGGGGPAAAQRQNMNNEKGWHHVYGSNVKLVEECVQLYGAVDMMADTIHVLVDDFGVVPFMKNRVSQFRQLSTASSGSMDSASSEESGSPAGGSSGALEDGGLLSNPSMVIPRILERQIEQQLMGEVVIEHSLYKSSEQRRTELQANLNQVVLCWLEQFQADDDAKIDLSIEGDVVAATCGVGDATCTKVCSERVHIGIALLLAAAAESTTSKKEDASSCVTAIMVRPEYCGTEARKVEDKGMLLRELRRHQNILQTTAQQSPQRASVATLSWMATHSITWPMQSLPIAFSTYPALELCHRESLLSHDANAFAAGLYTTVDLYEEYDYARWLSLQWTRTLEALIDDAVRPKDSLRSPHASTTASSSASCTGNDDHDDHHQAPAAGSSSRRANDDPLHAGKLRLSDLEHGRMAVEQDAIVSKGAMIGFALRNLNSYSVLEPDCALELRSLGAESLVMKLYHVDKEENFAAYVSMPIYMFKFWVDELMKKVVQWLSRPIGTSLLRGVNCVASGSWRDWRQWNPSTLFQLISGSDVRTPSEKTKPFASDLAHMNKAEGTAVVQTQQENLRSQPYEAAKSLMTMEERDQWIPFVADRLESAYHGSRYPPWFAFAAFAVPSFGLRTLRKMLYPQTISDPDVPQNSGRRAEVVESVEYSNHFNSAEVAFQLLCMRYTWNRVGFLGLSGVPDPNQWYNRGNESFWDKWKSFGKLRVLHETYPHRIDPLTINAPITYDAPVEATTTAAGATSEQVESRKALPRINPSEITEEGCSIEFKGVWFSFPSAPDRWILKDLSFVIPRGHFAGLVGPTGCGKSTILLLLFRIYEPNRGDILLNGISIHRYPVRWLRRQFGYVSQASKLFDATVVENVTLGDVAFDVEGGQELQKNARAAVEHALQDGAAWDFISRCPEGIRTETGAGYSGETRFSGGEQQRLSLSRALMKRQRTKGKATGQSRRPIFGYLLDEATSALDVHTELKVQESLLSVHRGEPTSSSSTSTSSSSKPTVLVVAHRLFTLKGAQTIIVLNDKGEIVETDSFERLALRPNSVFSKMVEEQELHDPAMGSAVMTMDSMGEVVASSASGAVEPELPGNVADVASKTAAVRAIVHRMLDGTSHSDDDTFLSIVRSVQALI